MVDLPNWFRCLSTACTIYYRLPRALKDKWTGQKKKDFIASHISDKSNLILFRFLPQKSLILSNFFYCVIIIKNVLVLQFTVIKSCIHKRELREKHWSSANARFFFSPNFRQCKCEFPYRILAIEVIIPIIWSSFKERKNLRAGRHWSLLFVLLLELEPILVNYTLSSSKKQMSTTNILIMS